MNEYKNIAKFRIFIKSINKYVEVGETFTCNDNNEINYFEKNKFIKKIMEIKERPKVFTENKKAMEESKESDTDIPTEDTYRVSNKKKYKKHNY